MAGTARGIESVTGTTRHAAVVRVAHWVIALSVAGLLLSGVEIVISHPRFYWGETGNVNMAPLFTLPIPASRASVPTSYGYVLPDQNGWSRSLHFQTAWIVVLTGLVYCGWGLWTRHFGRNLMPSRESGTASNEDAYNPLQRATYLTVIFGLFPAMIWTGLAMSPAFVSAYPFTVAVLGGQQSARTLHFLLTGLLVLFVVVHVVMVYRAGFVSRTRAMITGRAKEIA